MTGFPRRPLAVVLGSMSKTPVAGSVWQTMTYVVGLERLGFETYYVEAHARTPTTLMERGDDDSSALAAGFIDGVMRRFGLADRWALHALHADGAVVGPAATRLSRIFEDAACILNLHGGTLPRAEQTATRKLVYVETDPVELQVQLENGDAAARSLLEAHCAFFTLGTNFGAADCGVPLPDEFEFKPTLPPVLLDQWELQAFGQRPLFTTIGNWRQEFRDVTFRGEVYHWSKHHEFLKFVDLPSRTEQQFELALASDDEPSRELLRANGWRVRDGYKLSLDLDGYRRYIVESRGEFTVAKDQNIRLRSGWFSDRSASYLAAGCPVVMQDTGFAAALPVGQGLFAFTTGDEALAAIDSINGRHDAAARAAREIAREYLDSARVLGGMIDELGLGRPGATGSISRSEQGGRESAEVPPVPVDLDLRPVSRWPTILAAETVTRTVTRPLPAVRPRDLASARPAASVVVVTWENLVFTRLCLESVLGAGDLTSFELIVLDNGSTDGTPDYLAELARRDPRVRVDLGAENVGFPAAVNRGLQASRGDHLILLNNDTIVAPGWLTALTSHLRDRRLGLIGPVSNRAATEAEIETDYATYGEFLAAAGERLRSRPGQRTPVASLTLFCAAMRRDTFDRVGALDERFGLGMFEDDDYVRRVRHSGGTIECAEDVLVHHFGQASIGWLARTGSYGALFAQNRRRYDEKWATSWKPHRRRGSAARTRMIESAGSLVASLIPGDAHVLVVSKGDDALLAVAGSGARHFPQDQHGGYAGHHPADTASAIAELDRLRSEGASHLLIPRESLWWLDHYKGLREHLDGRGSLLGRDEQAGALYALQASHEQPSDRRAA